MRGESEESEATEAEETDLTSRAGSPDTQDEAEGTGRAVAMEDHSSSSQAAVSKTQPSCQAIRLEGGERGDGEGGQKSSCPYTHRQAEGNTA